MIFASYILNIDITLIVLFACIYIRLYTQSKTGVCESPKNKEKRVGEAGTVFWSKLKKHQIT